MWFVKVDSHVMQVSLKTTIPFIIPGKVINISSAPAIALSSTSESSIPRSSSPTPAATDDMSPAAQQQQPFPRHPEPARARQMRCTKNFRIFRVAARARQQGRTKKSPC